MEVQEIPVDVREALERPARRYDDLSLTSAELLDRVAVQEREIDERRRERGVNYLDGYWGQLAVSMGVPAEALHDDLVRRLRENTDLMDRTEEVDSDFDPYAVDIGNLSLQKGTIRVQTVSRDDPRLIREGGNSILGHYDVSQGEILVVAEGGFGVKDLMRVVLTSGRSAEEVGVDGQDTLIHEAGHHPLGQTLARFTDLHRFLEIEHEAVRKLRETWENLKKGVMGALLRQGAEATALFLKGRVGTNLSFEEIGRQLKKEVYHRLPVMKVVSELAAERSLRDLGSGVSNERLREYVTRHSHVVEEFPEVEERKMVVEMISSRFFTLGGMGLSSAQVAGELRERLLGLRFKKGDSGVKRVVDILDAMIVRELAERGKDLALGDEDFDEGGLTSRGVVELASRDEARGRLRQLALEEEIFQTAEVNKGAALARLEDLSQLVVLDYGRRDVVDFQVFPPEDELADIRLSGVRLAVTCRALPEGMMLSRLRYLPREANISFTPQEEEENRGMPYVVEEYKSRIRMGVEPIEIETGSTSPREVTRRLSEKETVRVGEMFLGKLTNAQRTVLTDLFLAKDFEPEISREDITGGKLQIWLYKQLVGERLGVDPDSGEILHRAHDVFRIVQIERNYWDYQREVDFLVNEGARMGRLGNTRAENLLASCRGGTEEVREAIVQKLTGVYGEETEKLIAGSRFWPVSDQGWVNLLVGFADRVGRFSLNCSRNPDWQYDVRGAGDVLRLLNSTHGRDLPFYDWEGLLFSARMARAVLNVIHDLIDGTGKGVV